MKVNPKIFRAYDIRGNYPKDINGKVAYLIGRAFVKFLNKEKLRIIIGRDQRSSSSILHRELIKGILEEGANVIDIGLSPSPLCYFSIAYYGFDGGIEITASHLPEDYNGFKLLREEAKFIGQNTGMEKIRELVQKIAKEPVRKIKGKVQKKETVNDYLKANLKLFKVERFKRLRVVIDTANAVSKILIPPLSKILPIQIHHLSKKRSLNPLEKDSLSFLQQEVKLKKADFGIAFDGDGDRVVFVSDTGEVLSGDLVLGLLSKYILKENPGERILYDISSSRIVPETTEEYGGEAIISRTGHTFVTEKMREEDVLFGGEFSGHYYHRDQYFIEAPIFTFLKISEIISEENQPLSKLILPFKKYYNSGQLNFEVKKPAEILEKIEQKYKNKGGRLLKIDGLKFDFDNFWFLIRASQTEPVVRLTIEANTQELLEEKKKELTALINELK